MYHCRPLCGGGRTRGGLMVGARQHFRRHHQGSQAEATSCAFSRSARSCLGVSQIVLVFAWLSATPGRAQQYFGGLTGTVTDATGAVLPKATVTVTNLNKGTVAHTATNEAGIYRAVNLVPDPYKVEVETPGFKRVTRE